MHLDPVLVVLQTNPQMLQGMQWYCFCLCYNTFVSVRQCATLITRRFQQILNSPGGSYWGHKHTLQLIIVVYV